MRRPSLIHRLAPLFALATAIAFAWPRSAASDPPSSQPADPAPAVGPIAYYLDKCARCHGDISAAYTGLEHPKRGTELKDVIDQMAQGPAVAPLNAEGLKQQTALHEAMFGRTPFVWIDPARTGRITGEALPGTQLEFEADGRREPVAVTDNRFELPRRAGILILTRDKTTARLPIAP